MMRFELGIERPNPRRAVRSALTIAGAYVAGNVILLAPYIEIGRARIALALSVIVTTAALTALGYVKGHFTGTPPLWSALYTARHRRPCRHGSVSRCPGYRWVNYT